MAIPDGEGTMYRRGPNGETPDGISINGKDGAYGTVGANEHVTVHGKGWHRSWDNPGTKEDHGTDHKTGKITNYS